MDNVRAEMDAYHAQIKEIKAHRDRNPLACEFFEKTYTDHYHIRFYYQDGTKSEVGRLVYPRVKYDAMEMFHFDNWAKSSNPGKYGKYFPLSQNPREGIFADMDEVVDFTFSTKTIKGHKEIVSTIVFKDGTTIDQEIMGDTDSPYTHNYKTRLYQAALAYMKLRIAKGYMAMDHPLFQKLLHMELAGQLQRV